MTRLPPSASPTRAPRIHPRPLWLALYLFATPAHADTVSVAIEGLDAEELANARAFVRLNTAASEKENLSPLQIRRLHKTAPEEIRAALRPFGYYEPSIAPQLAKTGDTVWEATYRVDPGPPIRLRKLDLALDGDGRDEERLRQRLDAFPLKPDERLQQALYGKFKDDLLTESNALGYLDAQYSRHAIAVYPDQQAADIGLTLDTGPQYRFGEVRFDDVNLNGYLLRRFVPFDPGDPYANDKLLALSAGLQDSGYFQSIEVVPMKADAEDLEIPIDVHLAERKRNRYTAGVGYGTDSGPRIKLGWENRRINRKGHRMSADVQASSLLQSASTTYRVPIRDPRTDRYEFTAGVLNESTDTAKTLLRQVGAARIVSRGGWRETLGVSYQREDFKIGANESSVLFLTSGNWTRTWADHALRPNKGLRLSFTLRGALATLLSDTNITQAETSAKWIHSFDPKTRLLTRGTYGTTWASSFDSVPASLRYFAGGDQSLRGYGYEELGPVDENGTVVGGHNLLVGSLELERTLWGRWGAAVFVDAGNAFDDAEVKPKQSAGVGARWNSPVGPIRLDVAFPIRDPNKGFRIHFTMGPDL